MTAGSECFYLEVVFFDFGLVLFDFRGDFYENEGGFAGVSRIERGEPDQSVDAVFFFEKAVGELA